MQSGEVGRSTNGLKYASINGTFRTAKLRLSFVIVGASVAGLACAYSLKKAGHDVLVLEAEDGLSKSPGGVRIPPNMSQIMMQWGLQAELEKGSGGKSPKAVFKSAFTGEFLGEVLYYGEIMEAFESDLYVMHHADLIMMLYKHAVNAGARFSFSSRVININPAAASVTLSNGEEICGDIIVGADGDTSIVRPILFGETNSEVERSGIYTTYIFTISSTLMKDDQELIDLIEDPKWHIWMGNDWAILAHAVRGGSDLTATIFRKEETTFAQKGWRQTVAIEGLLRDTSEIEPRLARLLKLADAAVRTRHVIQTPLDSWYDDRGHIVVVGDAAHLLNPGSTHSAALAMEDAVVFGELFSKLTSRSSIKRLLYAYQELRQQRCDFVRASEHERAGFVTMPSGPQRDARDASMRRERERGRRDWLKSPEEQLRAQWEEMRGTYGYNALEDAENWWVEWGPLLERMVGTNRSPRNGDTYASQIFVELQQCIG
ncbi:hypothetical protein EW145_g2362 [Phellinidium pouzarii]|uniref:FAD-binding domain-containing protein n=1 Tax=Phellinidium pouzarii TaxID=167371 RepID=A0A4S4LB78_9AGAM|nr:hypothetical protein EW145_g2362 [Phellinidium pouzarii]